MAAGGSGGRASCPPGVGPGAGGGPGPSANATPAPGNAAAAAAAPAPAAPGPPPPVSGSGPGPGAQAAAGGERAAEEPGAGALLREPVYNWQATKPTVKERFAFLFNNEVLCDVHFLVGKGLGAQRIPAHRWAAVPGPAAPGDPASPGPDPASPRESVIPEIPPPLPHAGETRHPQGPSHPPGPALLGNPAVPGTPPPSGPHHPQDPVVPGPNPLFLEPLLVPGTCPHPGTPTIPGTLLFPVTTIPGPYHP
ncbi:hypothetical protein J1605_022476 [Eschrichtius robustus]|uniref:Uncharacterized protein n=1 Tax=Eschrichtius robustus TaxID=9764 RepID=A0AB34H854_ESCRO|nr:hypothetical protein J1605_022476 [Eschrichtius robustus]